MTKQYRLLETGMVEEIASRKVIPPDPRNRDWQEYQIWLAKGNKPIGLPPDNTYEFDYDSLQWKISPFKLKQKIKFDYELYQKQPVICTDSKGNQYSLDCTREAVIYLKTGIEIAELLEESATRLVDYYNKVHIIPLVEAKRLLKQQAAEWRRRWYKKTSDIANIKGV